MRGIQCSTRHLSVHHLHHLHLHVLLLLLLLLLVVHGVGAVVGVVARRTTAVADEVGGRPRGARALGSTVALLAAAVAREADAAWTARPPLGIVFGRLELGVPELARSALGAEAQQIVLARNPAHVPPTAPVPVLAEATVKPGAVAATLITRQMAVGAVCIGALAVLGKEEANGHACEVIFMQELADVALLA